MRLFVAMPLPLRLFFHLLLLALWTGRLSAAEFTFAAYNVENYAPLLEPGQNKPRKSAAATTALHKIIDALNADILGVCEMGGPEQFEAFKHRLAESDLGYIDFEFVTGGDADRHLAIASRYPIVARHSQPSLTLKSDFAHEKTRRGILDVTIAISAETRIRCIGVHLKSKLAGMEDADFIRRTEARLLRRYIDDILAAEPNLQLLVYGDFNDTKTSATVREVTGPRGSKTALLPLRLNDAEGDYWTHFWAANDSYSRIDFLLVNRALGKKVVSNKCYLYRDPDWAKASDHRPLFATFKAR